MIIGLMGLSNGQPRMNKQTRNKTKTLGTQSNQLQHQKQSLSKFFMSESCFSKLASRVTRKMSHTLLSISNPSKNNLEPKKTFNAHPKLMPSNTLHTKPKFLQHQPIQFLSPQLSSTILPKQTNRISPRSTTVCPRVRS